MAGGRHHPKLGFGNILEDFDGMLNRDYIVVAADNERGATNGMKRVEWNVGLLPVEHKKLPLVSFGVGLPDFILVSLVSLFVMVPDAGREGRGIRLDVCPGGGKLDHFVRVAHRQLERDDAAVAPAKHVGSFDVERVKQGGLVVCHHFEGERRTGVLSISPGNGCRRQ